MRNLFDELKQDGAAAIDRLIQEKREESVQLEFKRKARTDFVELERSDKENLAAAISAFANSAGGLVLWGVGTTPNSSGLASYAVELLPISNAASFTVAVDRVLAEAVMPRHSVDLATIPSGKNDGSGFLAMYVDRSERRPHRSELVTKAYFKRIGNRTVQMEHYDIDDAFKRNTVAELEVTAKVLDPDLSKYVDPGETTEVRIEIRLVNKSTVSAQYPYLKFESKPNGAVDYVGRADNVIHPDDEQLIATISLTARRNRRPGVTFYDATDFEMTKSTSITCKFGCLNSRRKWKGFQVFGRREIKDLPVPRDMA